MEWIVVGLQVLAIAVLVLLASLFEVPKFIVREAASAQPSPAPPAGIPLPTPETMARTLSDTKAFAARGLTIKGAPQTPEQTVRVQCDYVVRYPEYWYGLMPFHLRLGMGSAASIYEKLPHAHARSADVAGRLAFESQTDRPWMTVEVLLPVDAAKVPDDMKKQTKQVDPSGASLYDFLITPLQAEAIPMGLRISHRLRVEKSMHKQTSVSVQKSDNSNKQKPEKTVTDEYEVSDEMVDIGLTTIWFTVKVRTLFGLSTGTVSVLRTLASPVATVIALLAIRRLQPDIEIAPLIVTGLLGAVGAAVPQVIVDALNRQRAREDVSV